MKKITQKFLKSVLDYNQETGLFVWKKKTAIRRMDRTWNTRFGTKIAGCKNNCGYIQIYVKSIPYLAHKLAWLYMTGEWPEELDHIDVNRSNNAFLNLRLVTSSQNKCNRGKQTNNKSGFKGVCYYPPLNKWHAQIHLKGDRIHLGYHNCPTAAYIAYCHAAKKYHGEFARVA